MKQITLIVPSNMSEAEFVNLVGRIGNDDWIADWWHIDDVKDQRDDLSDDQAREVLRHIKRHKDATIGINWDVIDCAADVVFPENLRIQFCFSHGSVGLKGLWGGIADKSSSRKDFVQAGQALSN